MGTPAMGAGRGVVGLAATVLGIVITLCAAPPARADLEVQLDLETEASGVEVDAPPGEESPCAQSGTPTVRSRSMATGRSQRSTFDDTLTVSDPDDATDTARFRLRGTVDHRTDAVRGEPRRVRLHTDLRVSGQFSRTDSGCLSDGVAAVDLSSFFTLDRPTLVTMTSRGTGGVGADVTLIGPAGTTSGSGQGFTGTHRSTVLARPGTYILSSSVDATVTTPTVAGDPTTTAGTHDLTVGFVRAGVATSPTRGLDRHLVTLPGSRSCRAGSLTATLRAGAGGLDRVVVVVNGRRRAVVETPAAGRRVVLRGLAPRQGAAVRVLLDPERGRTTAVTRRYAACTA